MLIAVVDAEDGAAIRQWHKRIQTTSTAAREPGDTPGRNHRDMAAGSQEINAFVPERCPDANCKVSQWAGMRQREGGEHFGQALHPWDCLHNSEVIERESR